jgi:hypothetical protein
MVARTTGLLLIGIVFAAGPALGAETKARYVGAAGCKSCHKKELIGNQWLEWEKGVHARAYQTLESQKALDIAKKKGITKPPQQAPECVKCHATSHGLKPEQIHKKPLLAKDGIQCESCHGPGSLYKKKTTMSDHKKAVAAGMWEPGKDAKICTTCHNKESPTWDAAKGFDFEAAKTRIEHPIPKEVKGKYLEVVKQKKAAGEKVDDGGEEE